jgi:hypothetical protein
MISFTTIIIITVIMSESKSELLISFILVTKFVDRNEVMQIKATRISPTTIRQPTR